MLLMYIHTHSYIKVKDFLCYSWFYTHIGVGIKWKQGVYILQISIDWKILVLLFIIPSPKKSCSSVRSLHVSSSSRSNRRIQKRKEFGSKIFAINKKRERTDKAFPHPPSLSRPIKKKPITSIPLYLLLFYFLKASLPPSSNIRQTLLFFFNHLLLWSLETLNIVPQSLSLNRTNKS